jgi:acetyl esterase/lipase
MSDAKISTQSSIQIITRRDRSLYTRIIHVFTSTFREYLARPGKEQPKGSIELTPHKSAYKGCTVTHRTLCDMHVYDIISTTLAAQDTRKHIYYFCGGGWQSPPSSQHWHNLAKVTKPRPQSTTWY